MSTIPTHVQAALATQADIAKKLVALLQAVKATLDDDDASTLVLSTSTLETLRAAFAPFADHVDEDASLRARLRAAVNVDRAAHATTEPAPAEPAAYVAPPPVDVGPLRRSDDPRACTCGNAVGVHTFGCPKA